KIIWIDLGVLAHFLYYFSGRNSKIIESIYSRGIFSGIRWIWDFTLGLLPVAILYIFLFLSIIWLANKIYLWIKNKKLSFPVSFRIKFLNTSLNLMAAIGFIVFFFYFLWGFNYNRISLERHLDLDIKPLDSAALTKEAELALGSAVEARQQISGAAPSALDVSFLSKDMESEIRKNLNKVLEMMGYPSPGRVRIRQMWPGDILMRFHVSGVYIPFLGEGYTAGKLTPLEKPFTLAHEMAHGLGFADEGSANFLAYLTCESSEDQMIKYSGRLAYWSYIAGEFAAVSGPEYQLLFERMPPGMIADLRSISQNWQQYRGTLAKIGEKINERYLKSQGIKEGLKSYNRMVVLVAAWRKKQDQK
ncbi:MAG: DUF3810 domain-containing protein, partial [Candidatus Aminicenantes bacterium]|nr:DUF3810 domain-containing protein [Candidatus Aminicenantes bacterium]